MVAGIALALSILAAHPVLAQRGRTNEHWVGTWATAVIGRPQPPQSQSQPTPQPQGQAVQGQAPQGGAPRAPAPAPVLNFSNQTLRQIVHTSIGGERVRVVLSNTFGTAPMAVGAAHLALRDKEAAIVPQSDRALTFSGNPSITIPAGAMVVSDPVALTVPALADLAIDLYLPGDTGATPSPVTMHAAGLQTNYVSPTGNHVGTTVMPVMTSTQSWFLVARVEVLAPQSVGALVAFGDSITDGTRSTANANNRWPDQLARRFMTQPGTVRIAVLNAAIAGNRVLNDGNPAFGINALARFDRDVLVQPGVTHVVVMEGINDIGNIGGRPDGGPSAAEIIAGHRQLIERAHTRGFKIFGATLTPFEGAAYFTPEGEAKRQAVNEWIRTSKAYDGVIDFEAVLRDPNQPTRFLPMYNSGDNLHPSDAGYQAMGNAIDLNLFKPQQR
jgi:lysophospholipase L1-like esterase